MRSRRFRFADIEHIILLIIFCLAVWLVGHRNGRFNNDISENSIFIYRVYLDQRGPTPRFRVLAFNGCHKDTVLSVKVENEWKDLKPTPMYNTCPEQFAWGCALVAYYHNVDLQQNFNGHEVAIRGPSGTRIVPVHAAEPANQPGITICVAPMFWYTDWAKLIFFIEWWKTQKAEAIMVYVHSTSSEVREVLNYYEKKGWITIVSWPMLPQSQHFQPNDEVYRLGQILAHNDCILRTKTAFASAVDIDEILHSIKQPLIDFVMKTFQNKSIGALKFPHHTAIFDSPLVPEPFSFDAVDYEGVRKIHYRRLIKRLPKVIVRTDAVERMAVHNVPAFRNQEITETATDAVLLHIRYDTDVSTFTNGTSNDTAQNFFDRYSVLKTADIVADPLGFQHNLLENTRRIFPHGASFHLSTQTALGKCTDSWQETQGQCKAPVTFCRSAVEEMENWVEETTNVFAVV